MRKTLLKMTFVALSVVVLILSMGVSVSAAGNSTGAGNSGATQVAPLSDLEKSDLLFLREEEKLARDVYLNLYVQWQLTIFKNIAASEQTHMDAIKKLLDKYGIPDPALTQGVFTNGDLQDLYDALIAKGNQSQIDAYEVGILIEKTDMGDLNTAIAMTTHQDIKTVYTNLLNSSLNHLMAFESRLN